MDRIACIKSFVRAVETGSFSAVAREQETTQPTISKQIAGLEAYLETQLLIRSTRHLQLTYEGNCFYEHCLRLLEAFNEAEAIVGRQQSSEVLRLNVPVLFGRMMIVPRLQAFLDRFPEIKIDLSLSDQGVGLVEEGIDLAIRIGNVHNTDLITQRIGLTRRITVAYKTYFDRFTALPTPEDLLHHNRLVYTRLATLNEWYFQGQSGLIKVTVRGNLQVNNTAAIRAAVLAGIGIAVTPIWLFADLIETDRLQRVQDYQPTPLPTYAVYRRGCFLPAKVGCLIQFLAEEFRLDPFLSDYGIT